jgi:hypothetical protein
MDDSCFAISSDKMGAKISFLRRLTCVKRARRECDQVIGVPNCVLTGHFGYQLSGKSSAASRDDASILFVFGKGGCEPPQPIFRPIASASTRYVLEQILPPQPTLTF